MTTYHQPTPLTQTITIHLGTNPRTEHCQPRIDNVLAAVQQQHVSIQIVRQPYLQLIEPVVPCCCIDPLMTEHLLCFANILFGEQYCLSSFLSSPIQHLHHPPACCFTRSLLNTVYTDRTDRSAHARPREQCYSPDAGSAWVRTSPLRHGQVLRTLRARDALGLRRVCMVKV